MPFPQCTAVRVKSASSALSAHSVSVHGDFVRTKPNKHIKETHFSFKPQNRWYCINCRKAVFGTFGAALPISSMGLYLR